jgi:hypothetical protein
MFSVFSVGVRRVLQRPSLLVAMWLGSLLFAVLCALPLGLALHAALGERPAALELAAGRADVLWVELLSEGGPLGPGLLLLVLPSVIGLLGYWLLQTLVSGGLTAALSRPGDARYAPPGTVIARAAETARAMLRLELYGLLVLRLPVLFFAVAAGVLLSHRAHLPEKTASAVAWRLGPLLLCVLVLWSMGSVILHYARALRLSMRHGSAGWSVQKALRLLREPKGFATTLGLALLSLCGYAALLAVGRFAAARLDYALFVGAALVVRQLCGLLRAGLGLSTLAAAIEVGYEFRAASTEPAPQ